MKKQSKLKKKKKKTSASPSSDAKMSLRIPTTPKIGVEKEYQTKSPPKKKGKVEKLREEASTKKGKFRSLQRKKCKDNMKQKWNEE